MNIITKLSLTAVMLFCFTGFQAQKQAYIYLDSLVGTMPETKIAQDALGTFRQALEQEVIAMQTEFDTKLKDYQAKRDGMSETVRNLKESELQELSKRIETFKVQANEDIQLKYNLLSTPIVEKAKKGIAAVAKELNYKSVVDLTPGNVLYYDSADNIFKAVKKKLDSMPLIELPVKQNNPSPEKTSNPGKGK